MPRKTDTSQNLSSKPTKPLASRLAGRLLLVLGLSVMLTVQLTSGVTAFSQTDGKDSPHDRARSYTYFKALDLCMANGLMKKTITTTVESDRSSSTSTWFEAGGGASEAYLDGYKVFTEGEERNCGEVARYGLQLWGWNSNAQFLESIGYTFSTNVLEGPTNNAYPSGKPGFRSNAASPRGTFQSALIQKIGGLPAGQQDALYNIYLDAFKKECGGERIARYDDLNDTQKSLASNPPGTEKDGKYYVVISTGTAEGKDSANYREGWTYDNPNKDAYLWGSKHDPNEGHAKCSAIAEAITTTSEPFVLWNKANPDHPHANGEGLDLDSDGEEEVSTCQIEGIGWIICPVVNFMSSIVDGAYAAVATMLSVSPLTVNVSNESDPGYPVYAAWSIMRNFANVAFVIAFLIIIFSQVSSIGVTNYGIKKLLPKIIIAAILVNISYWVCAVAVDVSNILGHSLKDLIDGVAASAPANSELPAHDNTFWSKMTGAMLAGAGIAAVAGITQSVAIFIPIILAAVLAIITVVVVLVIREALIILLIVISPLAFVALLLPNTEGLFKKWMGLFQIMLLMFPIIALIFGASALAGQIIMTSDRGPLVQLVGAGVTIIPLFITPIVMRVAGGMLGKIGAFVNNPNRGPFDWARRKGTEMRDSEKAALRAKQLNPAGGKNKFSRGMRRMTGAGARFGLNQQTKYDKNKAAAEAAESGYTMENADALTASRLRMAKSSSDSTRQADALKDLSAEEQFAALGQQGSTNVSLAAAVDSQEKSAEKQRIQEVQGLRAAQSNDQLATGLTEAIHGGDIYSAQAIENILATRGEGGVKTLNSVIKQASADVESGAAWTKKDDVDWAQMRTELARNMSGDVMSQSELLKNFAVTTELEMDAKGNAVIGADGKLKLSEGEGKNQSYEQVYDKLIKGGGASDMKLAKFSKQHSDIQSDLVANDAISVETMRAALDPNNRSAFKDSTLKAMKQKVQAADSSGGGSLAQSPSGELNISHDNPIASQIAPLAPGPSSPVSAAPSAQQQAPAAAPAAQRQAQSSVQQAPASGTAPSGPVTNNYTVTNNNTSNTTTGPTNVNVKSAGPLDPTNLGLNTDKLPKTPPRASSRSYTDSSSRQTPGNVSDSDNYHDGMQK